MTDEKEETIWEAFDRTLEESAKHGQKIEIKPSTLEALEKRIDALEEQVARLLCAWLI